MPDESVTSGITLTTTADQSQVQQPGLSFSVTAVVQESFQVLSVGFAIGTPARADSGYLATGRYRE